MAILDSLYPTMLLPVNTAIGQTHKIMASSDLCYDSDIESDRWARWDWYIANAKLNSHTSLLDIYVSKKKLPIIGIDQQLFLEKIPKFAVVFEPELKRAIPMNFMPTWWEIALPKENAIAIRLFYEWVNSGRLKLGDPSRFIFQTKRIILGNRNTNFDISLDIIDLYCLAIKRELPRLQNQIIDLFSEIPELKRRAERVQWCRWVYKRVPKICKLRQLAIDSMIYSHIKDPRNAERPEAEKEDFDFLKSKDNEDKPLYRDFIAATNLVAASGKLPTNPFLASGCKYHSHGENDECHREKIEN